MSKPWDRLRTGLGTGYFFCVGDILKVQIHSADSQDVIISIGAYGRPFVVQADTAKVLSEFFAEVAEQLENK